MGWTKAQVDAITRRLKAEVRYGYSDGAWAWMTPVQREALVAREVLLVVVGQERETVRVDDVRRLQSDIENAMGIGP